MTPTGHIDARNCGDSPLTRGDMPIPSTLFQGCLHVPTLAAEKAACTINLRHSLRLPFGSTVESWLPQAKRVPAT
jgi:hypothetical protein